MKRKHDIMVDGHNAASSVAAQRLFTNPPSPHNLQGQDLATERRYLGPKGWCLVAKQHARAGALVMEYIGEVISKAEAQQRFKQYDHEEIQGLHLLHISPSTVIDATRTGNDARYMGYSKQPSCQCQKWIVDDQPRAFMVALKDLVPGEELTFDSSSKCSVSPQVKCVCAAYCQNNLGSPELQTASENERMADAVLKCIQANDQAAQTGRSLVSTPPHAKRLPPCTVSPTAFCSPPPTTREDINALGLDSPDSFLDQLHRTSARPTSSSLHTIAGRCRTVLGQLSDSTTAHQRLPSTQHPAAAQLKQARSTDSGAVLASAAETLRPVSRLPAGALQQQNLPSRLSHTTAAQQPGLQSAHQARQSPATQAAHQLAGYLAQYKGVIIGGYTVDLQDRQLHRAAVPYRPMRSLKSVLAARLQAGTSQPTDPGSLLEEAGWQAHLQHLGHKLRSSPVYGSRLMPSPPNRSPAFPSSPLGLAAVAPLHGKGGAQQGALGLHQLGAMHPPAAIRKAGHHGMLSPATAKAVTEQQQSAEAPAVPPVDAVLGSLPPPNTPEGLQSCHAGVNSTLKTLGLTQDQIQLILQNAEAYTSNNGSKMPVI